MNNVIGMNEFPLDSFPRLEIFLLCLGGNLDLNKRFDARGKFLTMNSR